VIQPVLAWLTSRHVRRRWRKLCRREASGRPETPPSSVKQAIILEYARRFGLATFVETGTFHGGTVEAVKRAFRHIDTIELDPQLAARARQRFAGHSHVTVLQGDSGQVLPTVLARLTEPALFWLDAHYSGPGTARANRDTPIVDEISAILAHPVPGHVVLIDDARGFGALPDYPTVAELEAFVRARADGVVYEMRDDVIRIHRRSAG